MDIGSYLGTPKDVRSGAEKPVCSEVVMMAGEQARFGADSDQHCGHVELPVKFLLPTGSTSF